MGCDSSSVKDALTKCGAFALGAVRKSVDERTRGECAVAVQNAEEDGIGNTIRALLLADVSVDKVVSVTHDVWGIPRDETARAAASLKVDMALEKLDEYLTVRGMDRHAIRAFHIEYAVRPRLRGDGALLELWNQPEKLYRKLQRLGKTTDSLNMQGEAKRASWD